MSLPDFSRFVPAPGAALGPAADTPAPAASPKASPVAPDQPAAAVLDMHFVEGGRPRREPVPLTWPIVLGGKPLAAVYVRRLLAGEVRAYVAAIQDGQPAHLPMYEAPDGTPLSKADLDRLDSDDYDAIDAKALDFLPLALRGDPTSA